MAASFCVAYRGDLVPKTNADDLCGFRLVVILNDMFVFPISQPKCVKLKKAFVSDVDYVFTLLGSGQHLAVNQKSVIVAARKLQRSSEQLVFTIVFYQTTTSYISRQRTSPTKSASFSETGFD